MALLCAAAVSPALADGISPGLWQVTETVTMNGRAAAPQVRTRCLSAEQAGDTAATFTPEYRAPEPELRTCRIPVDRDRS